jgi:hypothetical protein
MIPARDFFFFASVERTQPLCFLPSGTKMRGDLDQACRFRKIYGSIANLVTHMNYK